jgi:hypothetical protein
MVLNITLPLQAMHKLPVSVREGLMVLKVQPFREACLPFPLRILSDVNERLPVIAYRRNEDLLINIKVGTCEAMMRWFETFNFLI